MGYRLEGPAPVPASNHSPLSRPRAAGRAGLGGQDPLHRLPRRLRRARPVVGCDGWRLQRMRASPYTTCLSSQERDSTHQFESPRRRCRLGAGWQGHGGRVVWDPDHQLEPMEGRRRGGDSLARSLLSTISSQSSSLRTGGSCTHPHVRGLNQLRGDTLDFLHRSIWPAPPSRSALARWRISWPCSRRSWTTRRPSLPVPRRQGSSPRSCPRNAEVD